MRLQARTKKSHSQSCQDHGCRVREKAQRLPDNIDPVGAPLGLTSIENRQMVTIRYVGKATRQTNRAKRLQEYRLRDAGRWSAPTIRSTGTRYARQFAIHRPSYDASDPR